MINLFIDTNIYLNFYHFSDEDLDKLSDLESLISKTKEIKLFVPNQVFHEYKRNRESKIKDALKKFDSSFNPLQIPNMCAGYDEVEKIRESYNLFNKHKKELNKKINQDIKNKQLKADKIIDNLFEKSKIPIEDDVLALARKRVDIGNPPGKNGSVGDAINWEMLLNIVPDDEDLYFISADKDYASPLDDNEFSQFLSEEWSYTKKGKIIFYKTLRSFFKENFPDIKLVDEYIKELKIKDFSDSTSFDIARKHIRELLKITDFTSEQINQIVRASISNDQIYNAHKYSPDIVGKRLEKIVSGNKEAIDKDVYTIFCDRFEIDKNLNSKDNETIPF